MKYKVVAKYQGFFFIYRNMSPSKCFFSWLTMLISRPGLKMERSNLGDIEEGRQVISRGDIVGGACDSIYWTANQASATPHVNEIALCILDTHVAKYRKDYCNQ